MNDPMLPLSGLSPVAGKKVVVNFDGGLLSSDGGILVLREVEQRLRVADRMAACLVDPRAPDQITHTLAAIMRFRLLMIAAGYEDGNDADTLRGDPMFKMALDLSPSDRELCSQPTISRLENLPDARALLRLGRAMVDLYCESFHQVPGRITLDIDDTFDAVHGGQQLRLFNAHYDEYGFQPIVVFDGAGRFITAVLRPAKRPSGKEIMPILRRLLRAIRTNWPRTKIMLRADSHYCCPEVLDFCRVNGLDYILGVAPTTTLRRHIGDLEASVKGCRDSPPPNSISIPLSALPEMLAGAGVRACGNVRAPARPPLSVASHGGGQLVGVASLRCVAPAPAPRGGSWLRQRRHLGRGNQFSIALIVEPRLRADAAAIADEVEARPLTLLPLLVEGASAHPLYSAEFVDGVGWVGECECVFFSAGG